MEVQCDIGMGNNERTETETLCRRADNCIGRIVFSREWECSCATATQTTNLAEVAPPFTLGLAPLSSGLVTHSTPERTSLVGNRPRQGRPPSLTP